jgi:AcrR family transcriptional regulator
MLCAMTEEASTKDRLVQAATRLFRQRGYDGTGLSEILAEAGVPKGRSTTTFPKARPTSPARRRTGRQAKSCE